jgi:hypothetical protein
VATPKTSAVAQASASVAVAFRCVFDGRFTLSSLRFPQAVTGGRFVVLVQSGRGTTPAPGSFRTARTPR